MLIRNIYLSPDNLTNGWSIKNVFISSAGLVEIVNSEDDINNLLKNNTKIKIIDLKNEYLFLPGLLDAHVHGHGGYDFSEIGDYPERLSAIAMAIGKTGVSYCMATFLSLSLPVLKKCLQVINFHIEKEQAQQTPGAVNIVGVHLEGPFITKDCAGAHDQQVLQEEINLSLFTEIISAAPAVKHWKITLSPDLPGAINFIRDVKKLEEQGIFVKVFLGHTNPEKEIITQAISAGAVGFTHLGNACQELSARKTRELFKESIHSRVVQWVLENNKHCPSVELITDGVHLSRSFISLIRKTLGNKILLVTDALSPAGIPDGQYQLGERTIYKENNHCYLINENKKILAGSAVSLSACIQYYMSGLGIENIKERIWALFTATVYHPRISSLSRHAMKYLPDNKNFVILHHQTGEFFLSACNGQIEKHSCP
jgi:N-acetylglucosamine-6-phosphate deacetylase